MRKLLIGISLYLLIFNISYAQYRGHLLVGEVFNLTKEKSFNKLLVITGIKNLVAQEFYNAKVFIPIEEKQEIKREINKNNLIIKKTLKNNNKNRFSDIYKVDIIIKDLKKWRTRSSFAIFSNSSVTIKVKVELVIKDSAGKVKIVKGWGKSKTKGRGMFFQVREDKIYFDATGVGRALKKAVHNAVNQYKNLVEKEA